MILKSKKVFFNLLSLSDIMKNGISNSLWNILASIIMRGSFFVIGVLIARLLGSELYGQFVFIKSTAQVFETAVGIAFGVTISKYIAHANSDEELNNVVLSNILISFLFSSIIVIIFFIFSEEISIFMFHSNENVDLFKISLIYILFNNVLQAILGIFKGEQKFKKIFIINSFLAIFNLLITSFFTFFYSIYGAIFSFVLFSVIQLIVFLVFTIRYSITFDKLSAKSFKLDIHSIKSLSIPLLLSGFLAPVALWVLNYLMNMSENGLLELAYFSAAFQIFAIVVFIPISISDAVFPILNSNIHNKEKFNKIVISGFFAVLLISTLFSFPIYYFSENIMQIYGKDFLEGNDALEWLALAAIFSSLLSFLGKVIVSYMKAWLNLYFNFAWGIMVVFFAYYFIPIYNASEAVAISFVISYSFLFLLQFFMIIKIMINNDEKII